MTHPVLQTFLCLAFFTCISPAIAQPPKVAKAIPDDGAADVDPASKEFRIVFDQPMSPGGMSIVGGGPNFPNFTGKPRWENDRTLVIAWQLEPDHEYWLSLNSDRFTNFRGANGESAVPHPISFHTAEPPGALTNASATTVAANREAVRRLQRAVDEEYSYRDLRGVNWEQLFNEVSAQMESAANATKFAAVAARLLAPAQDVHLWLRVDDDTIPTFQRHASWNVATSYLPRQIPQWRKESPIVSSGVFADGIHYLFIKSWPSDAADELEPAFEVVADAAKSSHPLIIDVRANSGGSEPLARQLAGCFIEHPVVYAKDSVRHNGKWSGPFDRELEPNKTRPHFSGRVAVLMGQGTVSSSESFVMMMKQAPNCMLIGDRTAGCSGNPQPVDLANGVTVFLPSWKDLRPDGTPIEGEGFAPDVAVKTTDGDFDHDDPVIAVALQLLRKPTR